MRFPLLYVILVFGLTPADGARGDETETRTIHGWVERIEIVPEGISLKAKLDTGATTSSLNALNKKLFRRDGRKWIAFDIIDPEDEKNTIRLERPIIRHVRIIRHDGSSQRRPVVSIGLCIGPHYRDEEMSLIDRTQLTYQVLVGRNHMRSIILVDSAETFLQRPRCTPDNGGVMDTDSDGRTAPADYVSSSNE